jgi:hypothetical protein
MTKPKRRSDLPSFGETLALFRACLPAIVIFSLMEEAIFRVGIGGDPGAWLVALESAGKFVLLGWVRAAVFLTVLASSERAPLPMEEAFAEGLRRLWPFLRASFVSLCGTAAGLVLLILPGLAYLAATTYALPLSVAGMRGHSETPIRSSFKLTKGHRLALLLTNYLLIVGPIDLLMAADGLTLPSKLLRFTLSFVFSVLASGLSASFIVLALRNAVARRIP